MCVSLLVCVRRVVIILDLEVVKSAEEVGGKVGEPTPYVEGKALTVLVALRSKMAPVPFSLRAGLHLEQ